MRQADRTQAGQSPDVDVLAAGTPLEPSKVRKAFTHVLKVARLPLHFTPHSLRHTFASILLQDGVSPAYVQPQIGRPAMKLTVVTYGKWQPMENKAAVDLPDDVGEAQPETPRAESGRVGFGRTLGESGTRKAESGSRLTATAFVTTGNLGGAEGIRTPDLLTASQARSQLRHSPRQK